MKFPIADCRLPIGINLGAAAPVAQASCLQVHKQDACATNPPQAGLPQIGNRNSKIENPARQRRAFSLLELLAVMAIIGIMAVLVIPTVNQMSGGMAVTQAGQQINDQLALARQLAVGRNVNIEVRFIRDEDDDNNFVAMQLWELDRGGENAKPIGRMSRLPQTVVINATLSPLLESLEPASGEFAAMGEREYVALRFRPNGRMTAQPPMRASILTAQLRREDPEEPVNYFTIQINPLTGRITAYRP